MRNCMKSAEQPAKIWNCRKPEVWVNHLVAHASGFSFSAVRTWACIAAYDMA